MLKRISLCVTSSLVLACAPAAHAHIVDNVLEHSAPNAALQLAPIGSHESGVLGKSAAEIVAYHAASQRILTVNARSGEVDILDASDPTKPRKIGALSAGGDKEINSVAVRPDGLAVAAVQQADKTGNGEALLFNAATRLRHAAGKQRHRGHRYRIRHRRKVNPRSYRRPLPGAAGSVQ